MIEVLIETFIRKQLKLKAPTVTKAEETEKFMIIHIDRLGDRLLRCGLCRQRCRKVHSVRKEREWRDLSMRKLPLSWAIVRVGWIARGAGYGWRTFPGPSPGLG